MNIMTMLYLFLLLFASQLFLVTPSVIREEQVENKEEQVLTEVNKTALENTNRNTPSFLLPMKHNIVKERKGHEQAKCKFNNCLL